MSIVDKILNEAMDTDHSIERFAERFLNTDTVVVGYEQKGKVGVYEPVGTYQIPSDAKEKIKQGLVAIQKFNFPKAKSYGVKVADIIIDKNKVNYYNDRLKMEAKPQTLVVLHKESNSNGNVIYAIVRENKIYTIYYAKSYVPQDAAKMRVDHIVKIDTLLAGKVR